MLPVRRLALFPALVALCALVLTACGDDEPQDPFAGGKTYDRLDAVSISGDVGSEPEVKWKGEMKAGKVETKTLTEGDGDALGVLRSHRVTASRSVGSTRSSSTRAAYAVPKSRCRRCTPSSSASSPSAYENRR